jgi:exodeoxyribonuclease V alpha subunit
MAEETVRLLDVQLAKFLAGRCGLTTADCDTFRDLVQRLSMGLGNGDSCLPVTLKEKQLLVRSPLTGTGMQEENTPLCVVGRRLYLRRVFDYEQSLGVAVRQLISASTPFAANDDLLQQLFGEAPSGEVDWQRQSAIQALEHGFLIISGGPGTGKTTTVVKIMALLQDAATTPLRVALVAPTGKAAIRLQESISASLPSLKMDAEFAATIPQSASTIHRLLGVQRHSPRFRHNAQNPLHCDVLVVDEASMVDLALMSKLLTALRPGCRVILLGDEDQLASVESGTVLADMVTALPEMSVQLRHSYRFDTGIKDFAAAINEGNSGVAWGMMQQGEPDNVSLLKGSVAEYAGKRYCRYMEAARKATDRMQYKKLFSHLRSFAVLCALRRGPAGVQGLNRQIELYLGEHGYHGCEENSWYHGRPVMINRNEYGLGLYNGDIGICLPDPENPENLKVWFEEEGYGLRALLPGRIGSCDTVYALTIHKSQGAEIGEVLVVLPEKESLLVGRELLYTGVTRARSSVLLKSTRAVFETAVTAKMVRHSGLVQSLRGEVSVGLD